jgi:mono/diheme cytochrome c family protein
MRNSGIALAMFPVAIALGGPVLGADAERGRALYENHCMVCHTSKVHRREPRLAADSAQLFTIVDRWQTEQGLRWSRNDVDDVVYFLKLTQYNF